MTLLVYITDQCRDDARRHGATDAVERLRVNVEENQSLSQFDPFPPPYHVKKKLSNRQTRLVAKHKEIGEHLVVVFLTVMIRGDRDYEQDFCKDPVGYGERNFDDLVSDEVLKAFVEERTASEEVPAKPKPSDAEYELLYGAFSHTGLISPDSDAETDALDRVVCESHEWVAQVTQPRIQAQLNRLAQPCLDALSGADGLKFWPSAEKQGWGVWSYRRAGYVLLLRVVDGTNGDSIAEQVKRVADNLNAGGTEDLLRASRRAYPAIVLADEQLWIDLEREEIANMALSPEETEVLESARHSDTPFPLFINGRAGSGKSTILQYLFADILFAYGARIGVGRGPEARIDGSPGCPLYLTANGELLRNARNFVQRLLTSEVQFMEPEEGRKLGTDLLSSLLDRAFQEFQPFMLGLLPKDLLSSFQLSKRVDYPRFRRMWEQRFGKEPRARKEYGPDVSWHVIRSYIKGMGSDEYLELDDYEQLPENQLTVTSTTFAAVHEDVWSRWYANFGEEGYWDDQDLARCILDRDLAPRTYSAVFCDEAQDFTRIELEVLLRLNLYSNRALPAEAVSRVPFAFAGDEFQTLNPTGFRWDSVKASFVEKFIFELDPARRADKAELNYRELHYNYRSSEPIVRFGNLVQAVRAATFCIPELRPQRPWLRQSEATPVLFFKSADAEFWSAFREQAPGFVVIVPCNEGEEAEFVAGNTHLREHIEVVDGMPRNVLSATRAKGCEYPAVVVYGFGELAEKDFVGSLGQGTASDIDPMQSLTLQYFINRVYVAVSRPKNRLVVVDTDAGAKKLWQAAKDEFARERLVGVLRRGAEIWAPEIGGMTVGRPGDLSRDKIPDRMENARVFEEDGRARRDAYLMMQAASAYREAGDNAKWRECRARALDYDDKPLEAGTAYAEAGLLDEARRCLWRAERHGWLKLMELTGDHPDLLGHVEVQWAKAIQSKADVRAAIDVLERFLQRTENDVKFAQASYGEPIWQVAVEALLDRLIDKSVMSVPQAVSAGMIGTLDRLTRFGIAVQPKLLAEFCYLAGEFKRAATAWEELGDKRSPRYLEARAKSSPYPENLDYFGRLGDVDRITTEFDAHPSVDINQTEATTVIAALLKRDRLEQALSLAQRSRTGNGSLSVALLAHRAGNEMLAGRALTQSMELFVACGEWEPVTLFLDNGNLGTSDEWNEKGAKTWIKEKSPELKVTLVQALAHSDKLPTAPAKYEKAISKFLRDFLRVKDNKWSSQISYLEAGAAHERTGRITDSLQFYEAVLRERLSSEEQQQIRLRWIAVKHRQLEYEQTRTKNDPKHIRDIEEEIQSKIHGWKMSSPVDIPEYPDINKPEMVGTAAPLTTSELALTPIASALAAIVNPLQTETSAMPVSGMQAHITPPLRPLRPATSGSSVGDTTIQLAELRIEVKRDKQLCLVTHLETMDTARLEWASQRVVGTIDIKHIDSNWEIPAWGLRIEMPNNGDTAVVVRKSECLIDMTIQQSKQGV